jgi:hypothetical protein
MVSRFPTVAARRYKAAEFYSKNALLGFCRKHERWKIIQLHILRDGPNVHEGEFAPEDRSLPPRLLAYLMSSWNRSRGNGAGVYTHIGPTGS